MRALPWALRVSGNPAKLTVLEAAYNFTEIIGLTPRPPVAPCSDDQMKHNHSYLASAMAVRNRL